MLIGEFCQLDRELAFSYLLPLVAGALSIVLFKNKSRRNKQPALKFIIFLKFVEPPYPNLPGRKPFDGEPAFD